MHCIGPLGPIEVRYGELQEQIAHRGWIKNGCIQKRCKAAQTSVPHVELLCFGSELIEHLASFHIDIFLESHDILETNAPVCPNEPKGKLLALKQLN
jgi:hypothetical protein